MTLELTKEYISPLLTKHFDDAIDLDAEKNLYINPENLHEVCLIFKDAPEFKMNMLRYLDCVDYIDHFELRYALLSLSSNQSLTFKVRLWGRDDPEVASVVDIWEGANLQEREIYDLMGVGFTNHPNMKRVFLWEGFPGHPLRKDFL
ncbi:MAG: NADH-quinone oxidoreductase subunit C [Dehalococcoidia bacterium]